jgi:hypothetical protein
MPAAEEARRAEDGVEEVFAAVVPEGDRDVVQDREVSEEADVLEGAGDAGVVDGGGGLSVDAA